MSFEQRPEEREGSEPLGDPRMCHSGAPSAQSLGQEEARVAGMGSERRTMGNNG